MSAAQELIGHIIAGRFTLVELIGEGGMATVYRAMQTTEPKDLAVKVMHRELLSDETFVKRFQREAKAAKKLQHPNTVQIVDYGVDRDFVYIAMELLRGKDLHTILAHERRLPEARAAKIMIDVCEALALAHSHGIVHRDLKPENVMLFRDPNDPSVERVKVLDFGIAKMLETTQATGSDPPSSSARSVLTRIGTLVGTPEYMSPEQCQAMPVEARSDIYACGIMLYQLLTGRVPFEGEVPFQIFRKHIDEPPRVPSDYVASLHRGLEATVLKALRKNPSDRHSSAKELADELRNALPSLSTNKQAPTARAESNRRVILAARPAAESAPDIDAPTMAAEVAGPAPDAAPHKPAAWTGVRPKSVHPDDAEADRDSIPVDSSRTVFAAAVQGTPAQGIPAEAPQPPPQPPPPKAVVKPVEPSSVPPNRADFEVQIPRAPSLPSINLDGSTRLPDARDQETVARRAKTIVTKKDDAPNAASPALGKADLAPPSAAQSGASKIVLLVAVAVVVIGALIVFFR